MTSNQSTPLALPEASPGRRRRSPRRGEFLFVLLGVGLLAGCGETRSDMFHVTGDVSFAGKPVASGYVLLKPDAKAGNDGLQAYVKLNAGRFDTSDRGKGVTGGAYVATVHGFEAPPESGPPRRLFAPYTLRMSLDREAPDVVIEVPASQGEANLPPPAETT